MRKEFIELPDNDGNELCRRKRAESLAPWASVIIEAEGGFWAFESVEDAKVWATNV